MCGVGLYEAGAAPVLLLSGGGAGAVPEAEIMRRLALDAGVPEAALLVEPGSRNTAENAREAARLLRAHGLRAVLLVSDRTHLPRAALLFRLEGIKIVGRAAPPAASPIVEIASILHELAALPRSLFRALVNRG